MTLPVWIICNHLLFSNVSKSAAPYHSGSQTDVVTAAVPFQDFNYLAFDNLLHDFGDGTDE